VPLKDPEPPQPAKITDPDVAREFTVLSSAVRQPVDVTFSFPLVGRAPKYLTSLFSPRFVNVPPTNRELPETSSTLTVLFAPAYHPVVLLVSADIAPITKPLAENTASTCEKAPPASKLDPETLTFMTSVLTRGFHGRAVPSSADTAPKKLLVVPPMDDEKAPAI
jgi:hypothetical protein